ncbi:MAG: hypothetical protein WBA54_12750, partial [Acidaminobacteraceae bacterium]
LMMKNSDQISINRIRKAYIADSIFEFKQGFYGIYIIISVLYLLLISQLPSEYVIYVLPFIIFSDPSILGLFFIGGTILLEKEQGVLSSILVTPLTSIEYILSKLLSLASISIAAALLISLLTYRGPVNYTYMILGTLLTSIFFTLIGIVIVTKSRSVNEFFVKMVPYAIILLLPCFLLIKFSSLVALNIFPTISLLRLIYFSYHGVNHLESILQLIYMFIVNLLLLRYTVSKFEERIVYGGK